MSLNPSLFLGHLLTIIIDGIVSFLSFLHSLCNCHFNLSILFYMLIPWFINGHMFGATVQLVFFIHHGKVMILSYDSIIL